MKILETRQAPNPRRVRIFLAEKGVAMTFEEIDLMKGGLKTAEFTRQNPFQKVPVLVLDDGTAICETMAICRYFEDTNPQPALFGTGARERAVVEMWNRRAELYLLVPTMQTFRHLHPAMAHLEVPQVAAWGEANRPRALEALGVLDEQLSKEPFVAGANFSVADITAVVAVDFMRPARIQRPAEMKNIERWYAQIAARPSFKA